MTVSFNMRSTKSLTSSPDDTCTLTCPNSPHATVLSLSSSPLFSQLPLRFNDTLVLRQLRYTGMLETVRIRQSGYSVKYSHQVRPLVSK